jgi:hypothetical protein
MTERTPIPSLELSTRHRLVTYLLKQARAATDTQAQWDLLSAAHIAGQTGLILHWRTHIAMLSLAWQERNWAECAGQLLRLALVPIGQTLGRLPLGNTGRADVNALKPMPVSPHLQRLIDNAALSLTVR